MSLTSELDRKDGPVRVFMQENFPYLTAVRGRWRDALEGATTIAPDTSDFPWTRIGSAIDYRLRFFFDTPRFENLVAMNGARYLLTRLVPEQERQAWIDRLETFAGYLEAQLEGSSSSDRVLPGQDEDRLCRLCFVLALLDEPYRSGRPLESSSTSRALKLYSSSDGPSTKGGSMTSALSPVGSPRASEISSTSRRSPTRPSRGARSSAAPTRTSSWTDASSS